MRLFPFAFLPPLDVAPRIVEPERRTLCRSRGRALLHMLHFSSIAASFRNVHVPHAHAPATGALLDTDDDVVAFDSAGGGVAAPAARDEAAEGDDEMTAAEAEEARGATTSCCSFSSSASDSSACVRSIGALASGDGTLAVADADFDFVFGLDLDLDLDLELDAGRPFATALDFASAAPWARVARWFPLLVASSSKSLSAASLCDARVRCRFAAVLSGLRFDALATGAPRGRFLAPEGARGAGGDADTRADGAAGGAAALAGRVHCPVSRSGL